MDDQIGKILLRKNVKINVFNMRQFKEKIRDLQRKMSAL